jgi:hypothetical protein
MNKLNVIQYMGKIKTEPYVHALGKLPDKLQSELAESWPDKNEVLRGRNGDNVLFQYQAKDSLRENYLKPIWREFIEYHTSREFFDELFAWCPNFDEKIKQLLRFQYPTRKTGVRFVDKTPIQMESQFAIDTPVIKNFVVKPMHLDSPTEFYKFLLRFPSNGYDPGGVLEIGKWKIGRKMRFIKNTKFFSDKNAFDVVATIPNTGIIFFLNGPNALHGVDKRSPNGLYRRYFNIVGETNIRVF